MGTNTKFIPGIQDEAELNQSTILATSEALISEELKAMKPRLDATKHQADNLMGIALSGGGIRSATFSLGVMQRLARGGVLEKMDYLSTVSGGGYIGSSLTWFLSKASGGSFGVEETNFPYGVHEPCETPAPAADADATTQARQAGLLRYLRQHGNYLTSGRGITITSGIAIVLRAMLLNLLVWSALAVALFIGLLSVHNVFPDSFLPEWYETCVVDRLPNPIAAVIVQIDCKNGLPQEVCEESEVGKIRWNTSHLLFGVSIAASLTLLAIFILLCLFYSFMTRSARALKKEMRYGYRRWFERSMGHLLKAGGICMIVGLMPFFSSYLQGFLSSVAPGAVIVGMASGMWSFFKAGQGDKGKLPLAVVAPVGSALLFGGLLLITFQIAEWAVKHFQGPTDTLVGLAVVLGFAAALGWFVNLNYISIHRYYRDRLMETFMPDVDCALANRTGQAQGADSTRLHQMFDDKHPGPFHIVNTNVVLVDSPVRRRTIRGGDSFILSPLYSGSMATGWTLTEDFMGGRMMLATAMAISGAAANPNTGVGGNGLTRNRWLSLLMSILNLRLGYWAPNPKFFPDRWKRPNHFWPGTYEAMSLVGAEGFSERRSFVQLSDGGHFENLALYELIRRRCKLIIVCDGGADPGFSFSDLQTALRRVRSDFGVQIDFEDLENIIPKSAPDSATIYPPGVKYADKGHLRATIKYPGKDVCEGTLVYLKTTMIDSDKFGLSIKGYKGANPTFPDQSTADQFFDEEQFEAYRKLGYLIADLAFEDEHLRLAKLAGAGS